ncbi:hypothetical protein, partial [Mycolicibacterium iranicum]|uniref:hypothetical protein n=1 Tax=Mycolicibacterium iranicum TaxID=912594 RepID=UPI000B021E99
GVAPTIESSGTDTDIDLLVRGKGTGRVTVTNLSATSAVLTTPWINNIRDTNGVVALAVTPATTPVNYLELRNAPTNGPVQLNSQGSDANVSILFWPKGSGNVQIYASTGQTPTLQAVGADANHNLVLMPKGTGYTAINSGAGNSIAVFSSVASPVNTWELVNAATGTDVQMRAFGTDTNIGLHFRSKGLGPIAFRDGSTTAILNLIPAASAASYLEILSGVS